MKELLLEEPLLADERQAEDERRAVDGFLKDVQQELFQLVREADALWMGGPNMEDGEDPPMSDPVQRERLEKVRKLLLDAQKQLP